MDAPTPRGAVDALTTYARNTLQCVAQVEILNTGTEPGLKNNLRFVPARGSSSNLLLLRRADRTSFLQLKVAVEYTVVGVNEPPKRPHFRPAVTMYLYTVLDVAGRELLAFHWHPNGVSPVRTPHFHASCSPPIALPDHPGRADTQELNLSRVHVPTQLLELHELVRFLIVELGVGPRRPDWETVLERNQQ